MMGPSTAHWMDFTYTKQGDILLTPQSILQRCANNSREYMEGTIKPLLNTHGFQPVVQGIYRQVQLKLQLSRNTMPVGGFVVSGDTAYVHFNGVFNFASGSWFRITLQLTLTICYCCS